MMKVQLTYEFNKGFLFNLSVGGFLVKNCRLYWAARSVHFPVRYDGRGRRFPVVHAPGTLVKRLRDLLAVAADLETGKAETPRDRRPCTFKIHPQGWSREKRAWENGQWLVFNFTVRGFTILGTRWQPESGCIQLPVTFMREITPCWRKKRVVCSSGPHINLLREALEAQVQQALPEAAPAPVVEEELLPSWRRSWR